MMDTPTPKKGAVPRKTGSHLVPENATPRGPVGDSPKYPKAGVPKPGQSLAAGPSGTHDKGWSIPSAPKATPIPTRQGKGAGSPAGSTRTISRRSGGSDKSKI